MKKYQCPHCNSRYTSTEWDAETKKYYYYEEDFKSFDNSGDYDGFYCGTCGNESTYSEIKYHTEK